MKSAERRFEKAQSQWTRHEREDLPAFERWRQTTFGPLERKIAARQSEYYLYGHFLRCLKNEEYLQRRTVSAMVSELLAYALERDDGGEGRKLDGVWSPAYMMECAFALWEEPRRKAKEARREKARRDRERRQVPCGGRSRAFDLNDFVRAVFEATGTAMPGAGTDFDEDDFDSHFEDDDAFDGVREPGTPAAARRAGELRSLYRKLCRRLHPDVSREATPETRRLWHEVQSAYEARDLDRLEALHAACELKGDPGGRQSTLSRIITATKEYLAGLKSLQRNIRAARRTASWEFAAKSEPEHRRLAAPILKALEAEWNDVAYDVRCLKDEYRQILNMGKSPPRRRNGLPASELRQAWLFEPG